MPTPLGNLRDITLRALDVLRAADLVVAEDTRVARRLLGALDIGGKRVAGYREANALRATPRILAAAREGTVAVTTDAGTPAVSDPGRALVVAARADGIPIEVLPGPSAFVCAAVLSGFPLEGMSFEGFVPRASAQRTAALERALASGRTAIWYESPQRIRRTLAALEALAPDAAVFVARELTKLHEQQVLGSPPSVAAALAEPVRGEVVLVLGPSRTPRTGAPAAKTPALDATIDALLAEGRSVAAVAKAIAREFAIERSAAYGLASRRKRERAED